MRDILCMYYSRTGATRQAMTEIAQALDAELVELTDGVDRSGARGYLRSGMDAMRRATRFMTDRAAVNGGYVWSYLSDFSRRWGEMEAWPGMIWTQAPGTPEIGVSQISLRTWS